MNFHELRVLPKKGVTHIVQQRVEHRLRRQHVHAAAREVAQLAAAFESMRVSGMLVSGKASTADLVPTCSITAMS